MENRTKHSKLINLTIIVVSILLVIVLIIYMGRDLLINYKHPGYKFSLNYPANWVKLENYQGAAIVFIAPKQNSYDTFQENVSILIQSLADNVMSLQKYTDTAIFQVKVVLLRFFAHSVIVTDLRLNCVLFLCLLKIEALINDKNLLKIDK